MKKLIISLIICICAPFFIAALRQPTSNTYANTACVIALSPGTDTVIVEDYSGNLWAFYGCEDWQIGDCVSLVMDDAGTEEIYDDEILSVRYSGWTLVR